MGVSSSLFSGVSGLTANGNAMSVIGNNIANANTIGFKSSRTVFGDLLSSQLSGSGGTSQVGRGVGMSVVDNQFSQGTFENTESNTDLAVEGAGFFMVSDPATNNSVTQYTRSGSFRFDAEGYLVSPEGFNVMGYDLDADGNTVGDLVPIWANTQSFSMAGPTSAVTLNTNLDSDSQTIPVADIAASTTTLDGLVPIPAPDATAYTALIADPTNTTLQGDALAQVLVDETAAKAAPSAASTAILAAIDTMRMAIDGTAFDLADPGNTSNYATSIRVYDSLGSTHLMTTYFTKNSHQDWEYNSVVDGGEIAGGTAGTLALVGNGAVEFDASGNLITVDGADLYTTPGDTASDPVLPIPWPTTDPGALTWVNGAVQTQLVTLEMETTQYSSPSVVISQEQDGFGTGTLVKLGVDESGNVIGNFSNGTPRKLMQVALAKFTSPTGLTKAGNSMYAVSEKSGPPIVGTVGSGVGTIFTNALEMSNVDLAQEFVKMITTQRGFSANSKTITTTDEMLAEVINMKR